MTDSLFLKVLIAALAVACVALAHRAMRLHALNAQVHREMEELKAKHEGVVEELKARCKGLVEELSNAWPRLMERVQGRFGKDYDDDPAYIRNKIPPVCTRCGKQGTPYWMSVDGFPDAYVFVCPDRTTAPDPNDYFFRFDTDDDDCDMNESRFDYGRANPEAGMCTPATAESGELTPTIEAPL